MEDDDIVIAVLYNGTLVQNDSGDWEYRNGKNVMVSVGKRCTKSELEDEIFNSIEIDRNEYLLKLKWIYGRCAEKLDPTEIRCDRDVKCFLQEVRNGGMTMMRPPLYVEVISKVEHVCRNVHQTAFASDSGSNLHSFSCPPIGGRLPQASGTESIQATSQEIMVQETQFRDQVDVRGGPGHHLTFTKELMLEVTMLNGFLTTRSMSSCIILIMMRITMQQGMMLVIMM
ncbi:uncharacterized protein LOC132804307 [Ziziphus jujuba]|uniref:Uncharacterized protein LOC132804307 n=1 Tax=Ziziphus jujuba TaxID=326968 RepID=A0ABM4ACP7_ZIZJJ|nr:uncharacterized protein LOC132804307 [Ziziphus jujuba]